MNASDKKVAFLVDFDNVATDVIEQALNAVFKDYGAAHIRRAYCNAEQAQHQQAFMKRLGLRAIVNLAIGKNSTDIALAVDAMELAISEKPDVIVLVSSDSDFAPLVLRLREKGAWLRGFGQYGKTGEGVIQIYDQFNELAHAGGRAARDSAPVKANSRGGRRGGGAKSGSRPAAEAPRGQAVSRPLPLAAVEPVAAPAAPVIEVTAAPVAATPAPSQASPAPRAEAAKAPAKTAAAKPARKSAAKAAAPAEAPAKVAPATKAEASAKASAKAPVAPAAPEDKQVAAAKEINAVLKLLPKLFDGQWHDLSAAAKVLKDAGLLAKSAPATRLFRKHPHAFQLQPEKQPNQVRFAT